MIFLLLLLTCSFVVTAAGDIPIDQHGPPPVQQQQGHHHYNPQHDPNRRQIWAWAGGKPEFIPKQVAQFENTTYWGGILDGIQLFCGAGFTETGVYFNETHFHEYCGGPIIEAIRKNHANNPHYPVIKIQLCISQNNAQALPVAAMVENLDGFVTDIVSIYDTIKERYQDFELDGISLDDESHCAPTANTTAFQEWTKQQSRLAMALKLAINEDFHVTSAVQALFGIQDVGQNKEPCAQLPSSYPVNDEMTKVLSNSDQNIVLQKWLVMDTYYFSTARFLSALDWYNTYIPTSQLGIGMMNRDDLQEDDLVARFHSIDRSTQVDWINIFMMPIDDFFLEYLKRWKTYCQGCGGQRLLGCYDMTISCDREEEAFEPIYNGNFDDDENKHITQAIN